MSRSIVLKTVTETRLRLAADRAIRACGPVLARSSRSLMDNGQARELDEARGALMDLAKALETH